MKEIEQTIKLGEKVIGRKAVPLNGAELEKAIWAGVQEAIDELRSPKHWEDDFRIDFTAVLRRLPELGRIHLSFPKVWWRLTIGREEGKNMNLLWSEIEIGLMENKVWYGQTGVMAGWEIDKTPPPHGHRFEVRQERDSVPDRIRERWGLPTGVEIRTADGRFERREIKFGGPKGSGSNEPTNQAAAQRVGPVVETETGRAIVGPGEAKAGLEGEKADLGLGESVREPVRLDKGDLLAETVDMEVGQAEVLPVGPIVSQAAQAPLGVTIRGKGGKSK